MSLTWLKTFWSRMKLICWPVIILAGVAIVLLAALSFFMRSCHEPAAAAQSGEGIPPGWHQVAVLKTPWFGSNEASEATAAFPAGSKVIHLRTQDGDQYEIGIMPGGTIVVPDGIEATVTVYEKREAFVAGEVRPWLGAGVVGYPAVRPAAAAGVDFLRIWRVHTGPGICANSDLASGVWTAALPIWRNIDLRAGAGYGNIGTVGYAGVSIGIQ